MRIRLLPSVLVNPRGRQQGYSLGVVSWTGCRYEAYGESCPPHRYLPLAADYISQPGGAASAKTWSLTHRVSERPRVPWHPISRRSGAPRERAFPALCHRPTGARCGVCRVLTLSFVHEKGSCRRSLHAGRGTVPCTGIGCQRRGLRRRHGLPSQARNERKFDSPRGCRKSLGGSPRGSRYKNLGPPGPGEGIARPP